VLRKTKKGDHHEGNTTTDSEIAILLVLSLGLYSCKKSEEKVNAAGPSNPAPAPSPGPANADLSKPQQQGEE